jgi:1-acyl-sn-glycerol-3-phosphate acyltransferase
MRRRTNPERFDSGILEVSALKTSNRRPTVAFRIELNRPPGLNDPMKAWLKHPLRVSGRILWLAGEFTLAALGFVLNCAFRSPGRLPAKRALWLQRHSRRVLRVIRVDVRAVGPIPAEGLLVCNHLSYVDILVLGALAPPVFVSKYEVKHWPIFGFFASLGGTIYVRRDRRTDTGRVTQQIDEALRSRVLVILFPEGTSSGGQSILPFKSSLLEPAAQQTHSLSVGLIRYELDDGDPVEEICYWRDMTLLPHLLNLLSKRGVRASVRFAPIQNGSMDRKELARQLHSEVLRLKTTA